MDKRTLKFSCIITMARFSKTLTTGFLMNTNNFTLTGKFTEADLNVACEEFGAKLIDTTEKVFSYETVL
jgi:hypothetical protein